MRAVCLVLVLGVAACGDSGGNSSCGGRVDTATAGVAPGMLTISGDFSEGQPLIQYSKNGMTNTIPAGQYDDGSASFTGLPSGMLTVTWILSCNDDSGQVTMSGPGSVTVP